MASYRSFRPRSVTQTATDGLFQEVNERGLAGLAIDSGATSFASANDLAANAFRRGRGRPTGKYEARLGQKGCGTGQTGLRRVHGSPSRRARSCRRDGPTTRSSSAPAKPGPLRGLPSVLPAPEKNDSRDHRAQTFLRRKRASITGCIPTKTMGGERLRAARTAARAARVWPSTSARCVSIYEAGDGPKKDAVLEGVRAPVSKTGWRKHGELHRLPGPRPAFESAQRGERGAKSASHAGKDLHQRRRPGARSRYAGASAKIDLFHQQAR